MPAWPLGVTYARGLLGVDQRNVLAATLKEAASDRDAWATKIASADYAAIRRTRT